MRIAQIVLDNASEYERKCQRVDFAGLREVHEVRVVHRVREAQGSDVAHVYGRLPRFTWLRVPYVLECGAAFTRSKAAALPPHSKTEAVEDCYFEGRAELQQTQTVGIFLRPSVEDVFARTRARLARTREDVRFAIFTSVPTPEEIGQVTVWYDPAVSDDDLDGFTAEALVMGRIVVASRTPANVQRLEKGRSGFLVPPGDANEATHAILTALFKPEAGRPRAAAAQQTITKFKARQRMRTLTQIYESLRS